MFGYIDEHLLLTIVQGDLIKAKYLWKHVDKSPKAIAMSLAASDPDPVSFARSYVYT